MIKAISVRRAAELYIMLYEIHSYQRWPFSKDIHSYSESPGERKETPNCNKEQLCFKHRESKRRRGDPTPYLHLVLQLFQVGMLLFGLLIYRDHPLILLLLILLLFPSCLSIFFSSLPLVTVGLDLSKLTTFNSTPLGGGGEQAGLSQARRWLRMKQRYC